MKVLFFILVERGDATVVDPAPVAASEIGSYR
jgi:hypothetical protein